MSKKDLETFAREAAKSIITEKNLKPFSLMLLHYRAKIECPNAGLNCKWRQFKCARGRRMLKNHGSDLMLHHTLKTGSSFNINTPFSSIKSWHDMERDKGRQVNPRSDFLREKLDDSEPLVNRWMLGHVSETNILLVLYEPLAEREPLVRDAEFIGIENCVVNVLGGNYFKSSRKIPEGLRSVVSHV